MIKDLRMRYLAIQVGPKSNDKYPYKRNTEQRIQRRGKGHTKMKAEIGIMQPRVKNARSYQKPEERKDSLSDRGVRGSVSLQTSWFQTSGLWNCDKINFYCFKTQAYDNLLKQP